MNEKQRLFLVQAKSDFDVFNLLRKRPLPECHALHYLQMATELLGKAHAWRNGPNVTSHRAILGFLRSLSSNRLAQKQLGYDRRNEAWESRIKSCEPLAERIQELAPALTPNGPNPEYPWPRLDPQTAPAEHRFQVWSELTESEKGRRFLDLLGHLFEEAEAYL